LLDFPESLNYKETMILFTVEKKIIIEQKIKKSRFYATIVPVSSPNDAKRQLSLLKREFKDATHHPYAHRLGYKNIIEKCSDDGEPPKSAGLPILQEIKMVNLTNTLIVVTRYFGGIKLGLGGLNRAYRESARKAIEISRKVACVPTIELAFRVETKNTGKMQNLLKHHNAKILEQNYTNKLFLKISVEEKNKESLLEDLKNLTHGKIDIEQ